MSGSLQLRLYRIARRDGLPTLDAARIAGIGEREAAMTDADDARMPPIADAYHLPLGMARLAVGVLADTPLGVATIARWTA